MACNFNPSAVRVRVDVRQETSWKHVGLAALLCITLNNKEPASNRVDSKGRTWACPRTTPYAQHVHQNSHMHMHMHAHHMHTQIKKLTLWSWK